MQRPLWATRPALIAGTVVILVVAALVAIVVVRGHRGHLSGVASDVSASIPMSDGVTLSAQVITPDGAGPFPLVVMPGSWGSPDTEYTWPAGHLASHGYQVVAYAQRGGQGSGGLIDLAGETTQHDARAVIDWALAHTHADPNRIGMVGVSYGAGISLLTAAQDPRVKAVVAMSGWAQLLHAFAPGDTPNTRAMHSVFDPLLPTGTLGAGPHALVATLGRPAASTLSVLKSLSPSRSATTLIKSLNANKPAIMLANAYADSVLDPSSLVTFFDQLTTPKRLQLAPGDHGGPEYAGLQDKSDKTFDDATQWLDHYLRGKSNAMDTADPVQLCDEQTADAEEACNQHTDTWHGFRSWPGTSTTLHLTAPNATGGAGAIAQTWSHEVASGTDSGADTGPVVQPQLAYDPPQLAMSSIRTSDAFMWSTPPMSKSTLMAGSAKVRVRVQSSAPTATLYAYLYDVDTSGKGTLMTYEPDTIKPGNTTITLRPMAWTVPAGDHLVLVVDTVDSRYVSAAPVGTRVTLSATAAAPATLTLPYS